MKGLFEPKFYEVRALAHLAKTLGKPIHTNYRLFQPNVPLYERPEIDGYLELDGKEWVIEAKSYPLIQTDVEDIVTKLSSLGFSRIIIIAPQIHTDRPIGNSELELVPFEPDLSPITAYYRHNDVLTDGWVHEELLTGWYHFRYKLAERGPTKLRWIVNQTDKRIKADQNLRREILSRILPRVTPIRVYWSINQWLSPKDLYFAQRPNVLISRRVLFDIDGDRIHLPFFPCVFNEEGMCEYCFFFAKQHTSRLIELLNAKGFCNLRVVFSGWRGFHVYVLDEIESERSISELVRTARDLKIQIDQRVTLDVKAVVGVPGTLHGYSMKPLRTVTDLTDFTWEAVQKL